MPMPPTTDLTIDAVYFAQTHVMPPDHPYFRLTGHKDTLIKVHVLSASGGAAPAVEVVLALGEQTQTLALEGPAVLPESFCGEPGKVVHRFDDCFTAMIPGRWIERDLQVTVRAGDAEKVFEGLSIGPPLVLNVTMFDIHYFDYEDADYPAHWEEEMAVRRPVTAFNVQRLKRVLFGELVIPPRDGLPAVRCTCTEDYLAKTGKPFNGKQVAALQWQHALQQAGGQYRLAAFFISIANVPAGGWAEDFGGCGSLSRFPVLHHEFGHVLDVDDMPCEWLYPYRGAMHGIDKTTHDGCHIGPTWGFDPRIGLPGAAEGKPLFISPLVPAELDNEVTGEWRSGPMMGGGGKPDALKIFSDWSVRKMQAYMEKKIAVWDEQRQAYMGWNVWWRDYRDVLKSDGVNFPLERDVEVCSVMAAVCAPTEEANFIYPLVGPYRSGLIDTFDPAKEEDRRRARRLKSYGGGWDVCLRIEQGGQTQTFMMPMEWRPEDDPTDPDCLQTRAVNLPTRDGKVTRAQLLLTPEAEVHGLPDEPQVLYERRFGG